MIYRHNIDYIEEGKEILVNGLLPKAEVTGGAGEANAASSVGGKSEPATTGTNTKLMPPAKGAAANRDDLEDEPELAVTTGKGGAKPVGAVAHSHIANDDVEDEPDLAVTPSKGTHVVPHAAAHVDKDDVEDEPDHAVTTGKGVHAGQNHMAKDDVEDEPDLAVTPPLKKGTVPSQQQKGAPVPLSRDDLEDEEDLQVNHKPGQPMDIDRLEQEENAKWDQHNSIRQHQPGTPHEVPDDEN